MDAIQVGPELPVIQIYRDALKPRQRDDLLEHDRPSRASETIS